MDSFTHHQVAISMAMHFVSNVNRAASVLGYGGFSLLLRLQIPYCMVVFWVFEQLLGCHRSHFE